mgnify:CR=1 FL=1
MSGVARRPIIAGVMNWKKATIAAAVVVLAISIVPASRLGSEFMPTLNEGTLFYMPTTLPGISVTEADRLLQTQDRVLKSFPEVERVFGKAGRAETPDITLEMLELGRRARAASWDPSHSTT